MVHLVGFVGSALIVTGVMMRSVAWLRVFALAGSVTFIVYGTLLGAWPVVVTNVTTTSVHLYHLRSHARTKRFVDVSLVSLRDSTRFARSRPATH